MDLLQREHHDISAAVSLRQHGFLVFFSKQATLFSQPFDCLNIMGNV